ncbi:ASN_collapsed_G0010040.mRNA.1.CDS.1 [Saccharomyces cerevisiae]|nr:ASN_collapsed_G0010040.mRNA.1.CDS.1 [Saccharomyces cerevisiae]
MEIKPVEVIDGVPVFKPSMMEFANLQYFIDEITKFGIENGIVKVIPPKEWLELSEGSPPAESLKTIQLDSPIQQQAKRWDKHENGVFSIENEYDNKSYNLTQWKNLAESLDSRISQGDFNDKTLKENCRVDSQQDCYDLAQLQILESDFWKTDRFFETFLCSGRKLFNFPL